jgi:hypothetical protein
VPESELFSRAALDPQISGVSWGTVRLVLGVGDMPVLVTVMGRLSEQQYAGDGSGNALLHRSKSSESTSERKKIYKLKSINLAMLLPK